MCVVGDDIEGKIAWMSVYTYARCYVFGRPIIRVVNTGYDEGVTVFRVSYFRRADGAIKIDCAALPLRARN